jgi:acetyl esterase/lipase
VTRRDDVPFASVRSHAGQDVTLTLDVYEPVTRTGDSRPAILWLHGGGFRPGNDKRQGYIEKLAREFAGRGFVGVSADYRVRERPDEDRDGTLRDATEDARAALAWVRAQAATLNIDPARIAVIGGSAGGRLAANLLAIDTPERVAARLPPVAAVTLLWGSPEREWQKSEIPATFPRTLLVHGTKDALIPYEHAEAFHARLRARGVDAQLMTLQDAPHTPVARLPEIADAVERFLRGK